MDLHDLVPKLEKAIEDDDVRPVLSCFELVKPLFEDPLVERGDLLVLSLTEGFHNFPLHAIQDEDGEFGPLILDHPVVYVPSLSVLHKCFWSRHASVPYTNSKNNDDKQLESLVIGGIVSKKPVFQYGVKAVERIGGILGSPNTTFVGDEATIENFSSHISRSDILHLYLHTNYQNKRRDKISSTKHGHLSQHDEEDMNFVSSPLDQAIVFNGPDNLNNKLTARQIIELQVSKGAHFSLMVCSSGRQGSHKVGSQAQYFPDMITDEVMGLVPALLFSRAGSVTSTLWPITDEHGAVFSNKFFSAFVVAREKENIRRSQLVFNWKEASWVDLAEIHRKAVLEMKRTCKQPSARAGFVLCGYWTF